jgi:hypothetical protein
LQGSLQTFWQAFLAPFKCVFAIEDPSLILSKCYCSWVPAESFVLICGQQMYGDIFAELWMPFFKYVRRSQKVAVIRFAEGAVADLISLFLFQNAQLHPYRITTIRRFLREPFGVVCKSLTPVAEHEPCDRVSYRDVHDISWSQLFDLLKDEWHVQPGNSS